MLDILQERIRKWEEIGSIQQLTSYIWPSLVRTAQLLLQVMNQQHVPVPASPKATALCSGNSKRETVTRSVGVEK